MMRWDRRRIVGLILAGLCSLLLLVACSPEASRTRGGGPGGDPGNRRAEVQLRPLGPGAIYYNTPVEGEGTKLAGMPIE